MHDLLIYVSNMMIISFHEYKVTYNIYLNLQSRSLHIIRRQCRDEVDGLLSQAGLNYIDSNNKKLR